jgi:hypothetical protein
MEEREMLGRGGKVMNTYAKQLDAIYAQIPKAVLAAIAVSFATCGGDRLEDSENAILKEWRILHDNGIVPQPPCKEPDFGNDGQGFGE